MSDAGMTPEAQALDATSPDRGGNMPAPGSAAAAIPAPEPDAATVANVKQGLERI